MHEGLAALLAAFVGGAAGVCGSAPVRRRSNATQSWWLAASAASPAGAEAQLTPTVKSDLAVCSHLCPSQFVVAVAIVAIVATKLSDVTYSNAGIYQTCSLGQCGTSCSGSLCNYMYAVAGVSMAVSLGISILQCCTCNLCGLGGILDILFAIAGTAW